MENKPEKIKNFQELSEVEKLKLFETEELEGRLETSWNETCNKPCDGSCTVEVDQNA